MMHTKSFSRLRFFFVRDFLEIAQRIRSGAISRNTKFARLNSLNHSMDRVQSIFRTVGLVITFELSF